MTKQLETCNFAYPELIPSFRKVLLILAKLMTQLLRLIERKSLPYEVNWKNYDPIYELKILSGSFF